MNRIIKLFLPVFVYITMIDAANAQYAVGKPRDASLKIGVAKIDITPDTPIWLSGYASREKPSKGIVQPIRSRVLIIQENPSSRIVFITAEVLGLSTEIIDMVRKHAEQKYQLNRSQLFFNSSHTHTGPVIWPCLDVVYEFDAADQRRVSAYGQKLATRICDALDSAMADLSAGLLFAGHGQAGFAINRRGLINPNGPTDHDVPVLRVTDLGGNTKAILFGYACHNTTIVDDYHYISGDYSGFAQTELERNNPGAVALFITGCAGDQNPEPRGTLQLAVDHGKELAMAVQQVLKGTLKPVRAPIRTNYQEVELKFREVDISRYQKDIVGDNIYLQRRAKLMLQAYNKGWGAGGYAYPIQAVRFGNDLTILGLSDEVVVDYSLNNKKKYAHENLFVAGYCNQVNCYIPNKRILNEGGYEADDSMIYYGQPGRFEDDVEDRIMKKIGEVMKQVGALAGR